MCVFGSVRPAPAVVRAPLPIADFSTLFPVTPIVRDLTNVSIFFKIQSPKILQVPLATLGDKIQTDPVGTPTGNPFNRNQALDR